MENIQEIISNILLKDINYQKSGNYYGFYDFSMYNKELELISDITFDYISPQINRAVKNKSYFYNCYGKEKEYYIENQG